MNKNWTEKKVWEVALISPQGYMVFSNGIKTASTKIPGAKVGEKYLVTIEYGYGICGFGRIIHSTKILAEAGPDGMMKAVMPSCKTELQPQ